MKFMDRGLVRQHVAVAPFAGAWIEMCIVCKIFHETIVAPFAGAWIEIPRAKSKRSPGTVAPFAGAWIEISPRHATTESRTSLPSRERGLKWFVYAAKITGEVVAPFAGAWIEIPDCCAWFPVLFVAPFAGAWIEISVTIHIITDVVRRSLRGSVD